MDFYAKDRKGRDWYICQYCGNKEQTRHDICPVCQNKTTNQSEEFKEALEKMINRRNQ